jgi:hypothetical protein
MALQAMFLTYGVTRAEMRGSGIDGGVVGYNLRKVVSLQPDCLTVPTGPKGRFFHAITLPILETLTSQSAPDVGVYEDGIPGIFSSNLYTSLAARITACTQRDKMGMLVGSVRPPSEQPEGEYVFMHHAIQFWHQQRGFCLYCNEPMHFAAYSADYLQYLNDNQQHGDPPLTKRMVSAKTCSLQRADNTIIHVRDNVTGLVCKTCNGSDSQRYEGCHYT